MKTFSFTTLFLTLSLFFSLLKTGFGQVDPLSFCGGMQCWPVVYLPGGTLGCTDYTVSMNDNFDNLDNWHTWYDQNGSKNIVNVECEEQFYIPQNVKAQNNKCILIGKHANNTFMENPSDGEFYRRDFTSGMIQTNKEYHFGRFEATIADMPGGGWWPAFWMNHNEELDIMERFWKNDTYSYNSYTSGPCDISIEYKLPNGSPSLFSGPHKFAAEWTPFKTTFYYNDIELPYKVYRYYDFDQNPLDIDCGDTFNEGMYYENPGFMLPLRNGYNPNNGTYSMEETLFKPILNLAVLLRFGGACCGPENVDCDT